MVPQKITRDSHTQKELPMAAPLNWKGTPFMIKYNHSKWERILSEMEYQGCVLKHISHCTIPDYT